jgi:hypothetical protein
MTSTMTSTASLVRPQTCQTATLPTISHL